MFIRVALISGVLIVTALLAYVANKLGLLIPFTLIVGLLVATAIIAPFADNLGKKLGKKRISWFGLRPRTTATIATIGSSWVIMFLTLTVLLVVAAPLRNALFRYESDLKSLTQDVESAKTDLRTARTDLKTAQQAVSGLQTKADTLQTNLVKYQGSALKSQAQARKYQQQAQDFQGKAQDAQKSLLGARRGEQSAKRGAQAALLTARNAQASTREALIAAQNAHSQQLIAQAEQVAAQKALTATQNSLRINRERLSFAQKRLVAAQKRLKTAEVSAERQIVSAGKQVVLSQKQLVKAQGEVDQAQQNAEKAKQEVEQERAKLADLRNRAIKAVDVLDQYAAQFEFGNILLPVDQTLAERRFDGNLSPDEISRELHIIADSARLTASKIFDNKKLDFVVGVTIADKSGGITEFNEDETIEFYSKIISAANQTVSGRLVSASNYPSNTPRVIARFVFVPIRTIYIARQNIAEATIDTNKSESAIFGRLQRLVETARVNAVKNGANPPIPPEIPLPLDSNTPQPETQHFFDGDTGPKMFEALRAVQKYDHPVKVRIVAARDLDSAEPLQIRFIVGDQTQ
ncbi:DUF3084 domain-containing protein [bacterium]|nr:MAG: DUF3084 domain-containing protein [bacterium]